jgi:predicted NBD/HSP70 family sugar kinase
MYVGVDIGGTKTLVGVLDDNGIIIEQVKFPTPKLYDEFVEKLRGIALQLTNKEFRAGCIALPGRIDHEHGIGLFFGNLAWENVPLQVDGEHIFQCPILLENDSKLGGLSESMLLPADKRVLYVTISTGIGTGLIDHRKIVSELANSEGGHMLLDYRGKRVKWESFASGHAIVSRYGKRASEIEDPAIWHRIAYDLTQGFIELMAILQPDIIVIGGSVGRYFDKFRDFLSTEVAHFHDPLVPIPEFIAAARPDEAVLYGCYDLAKATYGNNA